MKDRYSGSFAEEHTTKHAYLRVYRYEFGDFCQQCARQITEPLVAITYNWEGEGAICDGCGKEFPYWFQSTTWRE